MSDLTAEERKLMLGAASRYGGPAIEHRIYEDAWIEARAHYTAETERLTERAWRNGWGSALNAFLAAREMAEKNRKITPSQWAAAQALDWMFQTLVDVIGGLTEEFVAEGREIGLASTPSELPPWESALAVPASTEEQR